MPVDELVVKGGREEARIAIEEQFETDVCMLVLEGLLQGQGIIGIFQSVHMCHARVITGGN